MLPIKKVLHPTDFSDGAATAFNHALHLARQHEAELHLLHVVPTFGEDPILGAYEAAIDETAFFQTLWSKAEVQMRDLAESLRHRDTPLCHVLLRGPNTAPVILDYAKTESIDVIVMGTHGRRGIKHMLLGSVTEEVVHQAPCHVLTVRRQKGPSDEARPIQRILVPTDFSEHAAPLVLIAKELAASYGAQLHLLHVITLPFSLLTSMATLELIHELTEKARTRLNALVEKASGSDVPVKIHVREGYTAESILEVSEEQQADLIMMAPRGLTGLERFFLGSVAERVVRTASSPVFIAMTEQLDASDTAGDKTATAATFETEHAAQ